MASNRHHGLGGTSGLVICFQGYIPSGFRLSIFSLLFFFFYPKPPPQNGDGRIVWFPRKKNKPGRASRGRQASSFLFSYSQHGYPKERRQSISEPLRGIGRRKREGREVAALDS
ncbi:hypothetical protein CGRA01v4_02358 [Colletotrichum graminicola]|uniref:Uncharacterized protein n=1 Tax=Colletotrichum graminicola (strain M1.001 / M2 / FGSC 10212) TaxID=645133 RepID=E3Q3J7_COLGM|nr:uncharacterized protein GLRG_00743 [Colletotrichum graminicola M1.001]EFQ25599.1 hypothetical protein GLRG_00743 [Colletotrichum graminicola M1.001]WDK11079.1 hypothetical protein CGRA01v4_02358 [Colletotrichum graminicola]